MSAPSKEEIAGVVDNARLRIARNYETAGARVIVALADENERLEALFQQTQGVNSDWVGIGVKLRAENERLRAELAEMRNQRYALIKQGERLHLERAECLEAFETLRRMAKSPMRLWETGDVIDAHQVDELCEEMVTKLRGQQP